MKKIWRPGLLPLNCVSAVVARLFLTTLMAIVFCAGVAAFAAESSTVVVAEQVAVPLSSASGWQILKFKKIPPNQAEFNKQGLTIRVAKSAGPIVYKLNEKVDVGSFVVRGSWSGHLNLSKNVSGNRVEGIQGEKGFDDSVLRFGLVVEGDKKLNFMQKTVAPDWITRLHALAAPGQGVDRIEFFNLVHDKRILGTKRQHPLSDILIENNVSLISGESFEIKQNLQKSLPVLGIWLSVDGDDTQSTFDTRIESIILNPPN